MDQSTTLLIPLFQNQVFLNYTNVQTDQFPSAFLQAVSLFVFLLVKHQIHVYWTLHASIGLRVRAPQAAFGADETLVELAQVKTLLAGYFSVEELYEEVADAKQDAYDDENDQSPAYFSDLVECYLVALSDALGASLKDLVNIHVTGGDSAHILGHPAQNWQQLGLSAIECRISAEQVSNKRPYDVVIVLKLVPDDALILLLTQWQVEKLSKKLLNPLSKGLVAGVTPFLPEVERRVAKCKLIRVSNPDLVDAVKWQEGIFDDLVRIHEEEKKFPEEFQFDMLAAFPLDLQKVSQKDNILRRAKKIGNRLEVFIERNDLRRRQQILVLLADEIRNSIGDMQEGRQLDSPKKVLLPGPSILIEGIKMMDILMRVLQCQPSPVDLPDNLLRTTHLINQLQSCKNNRSYYYLTPPLMTSSLFKKQNRALRF